MDSSYTVVPIVIMADTVVEHTGQMSSQGTSSPSTTGDGSFHLDVIVHHGVLATHFLLPNNTIAPHPRQKHYQTSFQIPSWCNCPLRPSAQVRDLSGDWSHAGIWKGKLNMRDYKLFVYKGIKGLFIKDVIRSVRRSLKTINFRGRGVCPEMSDLISEYVFCTLLDSRTVHWLSWGHSWSTVTTLNLADLELYSWKFQKRK